MSEPLNIARGSSIPLAGTEQKFQGFPEFRSNVLYCPKQFFSVVIPHSSVNCIRLIAYMLRKTLGYVDETGEPIQERHEFSYRELEQAAGVSHSRLPEAIDDALKLRFIRCTRKARVQTQGVRAQSAAYELCWDENRYTDELEEFQGFYLQPAYIDRDGQNRIGRKNIPNVFFDYVVRNENRSVIRVVGTLLWYSIDWGKGGERRQPVKRSLRELVDLTELAKGSVVRALDEAEEKGYVERLERGVFDLSGSKQSSTTVYGIRWTSQYTYTPVGHAVSISSTPERSQNETQNAPKTRRGTLPKRDTERSQNETRNAPKTRHGERSQNETIRITNKRIINTPINNSSASERPEAAVAVVAGLVEQLVQEGFTRAVAESLAGKASPEAILRQVRLLPLRKPSKNKLGLLRKAIEENWPAPEGLKQTTDVCSSPGRSFAAHFYAGYHGNPEDPVSDPSEADSDAANQFVVRLLSVEPNEELIAGWGRQFGELVSYRHREKRVNFPALQPAIRQFGDEFFARFKSAVEVERRHRGELARKEHFLRFHGAYRAYLRRMLAAHEEQPSPLFEEFLREEGELLQLPGTSRVLPSSDARLEHFERFLMLAQSAHDVLDFWGWDSKYNPERFEEVKL